MSHHFGERRIYYNNFAEHLLNRYNPNMTYPDAPYRWSDDDWRGVIDMVADYGFNVFEFWLVPRLFCREALDSDYGAEFVRQLKVAAAEAHARGMKVEALCGLVTVGGDWMSLCPNCPEEWAEVRYLWEAWARKLDCVDIFGIFPGDPGACSRHGCTAITYIDKSIEISHLVQSVHPGAEFEFGTWGPPFFGWGLIEGPAGWQGEFVQSYQHTAWRFDAQRCRESMEHLIRRLPDFAQPVQVAVNLGFNPDGIPQGEEDARPWARRLARIAPVLTWDFSLTEGENAILPHYRFHRLFEQRRREREVGAYSGGICYTMTPFLNCLSLYEAARSFVDPDADCDAVAREFYERAFGPGAGELAEDLILFEIIQEWGNHVTLDLGRAEFHRRMARLAERLANWKGRLTGTLTIYPSPEFHRAELEFFARLFRDLSGDAPDFTALRQKYWLHVYAIYDTLPRHVDPRPESATDGIVNFFRNWERETVAAGEAGPMLGKWV